MSYYSNDGRMSCWSVLLISFVEKVVEEEIMGRLTWIHPFGSIATSGPHTQYRRQEIAPAHALSPGLQLLWWTKSGSIVCREWRRVMQFHENKSNKWRRGGPISHTHTKEYTFELTSDMGIACAALSSNLIRTMTGGLGLPISSRFQCPVTVNRLSGARSPMHGRSSRGDVTRIPSFFRRFNLGFLTCLSLKHQTSATANVTCTHGFFYDSTVILKVILSGTNNFKST